MPRPERGWTVRATHCTLTARCLLVTDLYRFEPQTRILRQRLRRALELREYNTRQVRPAQVPTLRMRSHALPHVSCRPSWFGPGS